MFLAEMGPNAVINCSSDLGSRDMNQNHNWINDARQQYSNADLVDANTFVRRMSGNFQGNGEEEDKNIMDYQTLNEKQMIVFKRIESHYSDILAGHLVVLLRIIVMGTARTGKTYLIKGIQG